MTTGQQVVITVDPQERIQLQIGEAGTLFLGKTYIPVILGLHLVAYATFVAAFVTAEILTRAPKHGWPRTTPPLGMRRCSERRSLWRRAR